MAEDDYSDLLPGEPQRQSRSDILYNALVPDYLKYKEPSPMPPPGTPPGKIGPPSGMPTPMSVAGEALPDVLSWLSPGVKGAATAAKTLGIMAGPLAKTANMGNYRNAVDMIMKGTASKENIFDKTGWFQRTGAGQLAHEISDEGMNALALGNARGERTSPRNIIQGKITKPLSEVISHPKLFEAYPEAKNVTVHIDPLSPYLGGVFNYPESGHITLAGQANKAGLSEEQQGSLIHEIQHWVQQKEGWPFGAGGSKDYEKLLRKAAAARLSDMSGDDLRRPEIYQVLKALEDKPPGSNAWDTPQFQMYVRHPVENEAMNVDTRHAFDKFGKYKRNPDVTDPEEMAAVLKNQGLTWGKTYGTPNFGSSVRSGRPTGWILYPWGESNKINPETLDPATREMWDRLPTYHDRYNKPTEMIGDRKYPWKTEMFPSSKVHPYDRGLNKVIRSK